MNTFITYIDSTEIIRLFNRSRKSIALDQLVEWIQTKIADELDLDMLRAYIALPIGSTQPEKIKYADFLDHREGVQTLRLAYKETPVFTTINPPNLGVLIAVDAMAKLAAGARNFVFAVTGPQYEPLMQELRRAGASVTLLRLEDQKIYPIPLFRAVDSILELDPDGPYLTPFTESAD